MIGRSAWPPTSPLTLTSESGLAELVVGLLHAANCAMCVANSFSFQRANKWPPQSSWNKSSRSPPAGHTDRHQPGRRVWPKSRRRQADHESEPPVGDHCPRTAKWSDENRNAANDPAGPLALYLPIFHRLVIRAAAAAAAWTTASVVAAWPSRDHFFHLITARLRANHAGAQVWPGQFGRDRL
jgi:hypothetical protein